MSTAVALFPFCLDDSQLDGKPICCLSSIENLSLLAISLFQQTVGVLWRSAFIISHFWIACKTGKLNVLPSSGCFAMNAILYNPLCGSRFWAIREEYAAFTFCLACITDMFGGAELDWVWSLLGGNSTHLQLKFYPR